MLTYEELKLIWWLLVGVLLIGFAIADGFDMGAMIMLPLVSKTDEERRVALNVVGPHWDGNQVWLITAAGAIFAAWPVLYAVAFSGLYWGLLLVLFALFFRPVGFEYRSKLNDSKWRSTWDWALFAGSLVPALVFGVAFGNLFLGVPFSLDESMRSTYTGNSLFGLLTPFPLLCGIVSISMLAMHGGIYLQLRTEGEIYQRAQKYSMYAGIVMLICLIIAGAWLALGNIEAYKIIEMGDPDMPLEVTAKMVTHSGSWMENYSKYPITMLAPIAALACGLGAILLSKIKHPGYAFLMSSLTIVGVIFTAGCSLFPMLLPSSVNPSHSLTLWDVTSTEYTLTVMLIVALIFVPIVLAYTLWCYYKLWGKVTKKAITENSVGLY